MRAALRRHVGDGWRARRALHRRVPAAFLAAFLMVCAALAAAPSALARPAGDEEGFVSEAAECSSLLGVARAVECQAVTVVGDGVGSALWLRRESGASRLTVLHLESAAGRVLAGDVPPLVRTLVTPDLLPLVAAALDTGSDLLLVLGASAVVTPDAPDELRDALAAALRAQPPPASLGLDPRARPAGATGALGLVKWFLGRHRSAYPAGIAVGGIGATAHEALLVAAAVPDVRCTALLRAALPGGPGAARTADSPRGEGPRAVGGPSVFIDRLLAVSGGRRRVVVEFADDANCCKAGQVGLPILRARWDAIEGAATRAVRFTTAPTGAPLGLSAPLLACPMPADPTGPTVRARLRAEGTVFECQAARPTEVELRAVTGGGAGSDGPQRMKCPGTLVAPGVGLPRQWAALAATQGLAAAEAPVRSELPPPWLIWNDGRPQLVNTALVDRLAPLGLKLEGLDLAGRVLESVAIGSAPPSLSPSVPQWRYSIDVGGVRYRSAVAAAVRFEPRPSGVYGAMTVGRTRAGEPPRLLGSLAVGVSDWAGNPADPYAVAGLDALRVGRSARDVRIADLNNDGIPDIVGNVYGAGCTLIGIGQEDGSYVFSSPVRRDGNCISGHGETILVADFDNDGLLDIFLPSYERFDLLHNQGEGRFVEIADELGISFPNYLPQVEGAAAVDLDEDGWVDIVVANEVLMNNRRGGFDRTTEPFGPVPLFDEGLSVADVDADGFLDVVKNHPDLGPRIYWGTRTRTGFVDSGWLFGEVEVQRRSFGLAVGRVSGGERPDIVTAGGLPFGTPPRLCVQPLARRFQCLSRVFAPAPGEWHDLLLVTDVAGEGQPVLLARAGNIFAHVPQGGPPMRHRFQIELLDARGLPVMHGRTVRATCAIDNSLVGLAFVDGGNGYMAQGAYAVLFGSDWCTSLFVETGVNGQPRRLGPFAPGVHAIRVPQR